MAEINVYADINLHKNALIDAKLAGSATAPASPQEGQIYYNTSDKQFYGWNNTSWVNLSQVVTNALTLKGNITNANTNPAYPASPVIGDSWFISTNAGTVGGQAVDIGDQLIYGTSGWFIVQANLQQATQALAGFARFATQAEANAGSDAQLMISPATLAAFLIAFLYTRKAVFTVTTLTANTPTQVTHGLNLADASEVVVECYQGGSKILLDVKPDTINRVLIESNTTLSNVKVICIG